MSRSQKLSSSNQTSLASFSKLIVVLEIVVTALTIPLLALSQYLILTIAMAPFLLFIMASYLYGAKKMSVILEGAAQASQAMSSPSSGGDAKASRAIKARRAVVLIKQTALLVVFFAALAFLTAIVYSLFTLIGLQHFQDPKSAIGWTVTVNMLLWQFIVCVLVVITRYVHLSLSRAHFAASGSTVTSGTHTGTGVTDSARFNAHQIAPAGNFESAIDTRIDSVMD